MNTIVQRHVRKRGFFGKLFKLLFIAFNIAMLIWVIAYLSLIGKMVDGASNGAEAAGATIGGTLGTGMLVFIWVAGAIILGLFTLFTRGNTVIITEEQK
jgi:hypothetical protein